MLSFPHCLLSLHILVILKIQSNLKNLSDSNQNKKYMYEFQKIYDANKSYLQSNSYSLTENIKLRLIKYNLTQTKTKILYYPLKCLKKTNKLPTIWKKKKKKIINVISYTLKKKKKKENLQDKVNLESYLFHLFFESDLDC